MAKRAPRLQFTEEERASPELAPAIQKADKRIKKLEKAEAKVPKKEVKQRVVDSDGKITTRLSFEEKKPPSKLSHAAKVSGDTVLHGVHRKVQQSNDGDNAGVDAANTLTEDAESVYQVGREIHHAHELQPYRKAHRAEKKADKANVKALNQEFEQQNGGFSSNPYSRWQQKRAIKREYAAAKAGRGTANTVKASEITKKAAEKSAEAGKKAGEFVAKHKKGFLIVGLIAAVFLLFTNLFSSCSLMFQGASSSIAASTYPSLDEDMLAAEAQYCAMEAELQEKLDNYEAEHDYDEYHYELDDIEHDPYVLISAITALMGREWTISEVGGILDMLFEKQYILTETVETETRYRTETRTGSYTYYDYELEDWVTEEYEYDVEVPYTYYICTVKLENFNLSHVPVYIMSQEQLSLYAMYMGTLGNRPDLFGSSSYVGRYYGSEYPKYEIPPEALEDEQFAAIIKEAEKYLGFPYVWGGSSPSTSFDCSGFVSYVYNNCGLGWNFGRLGAEGLRQTCAYVSPANAKPGDLIFFQGTYDTTGASHVGIYVGNNTMLHCGDPIQYSDITSSYWQQHFYQFGRLPSPYSFGYIAGWSSGKETKELKSSLDTIRKTAAEMIEGIDGKLKVLLAEKAQSAEKETEMPAEPMPEAPIYRETANYAYEAGELESYHASLAANEECRRAIEAAISSNYGDNRLNADAAVKSVLEQFSPERIRYVLANTIQQKDFDGRIPQPLKEWAKSVEVCPENASRFLVDKPNPGLTALFVDAFRQQTEPQKEAVSEKTEERDPEVVAWENDEITSIEVKTVEVKSPVAPLPEEAAKAPKAHRLTAEEKEIKAAVMDTLKGQIAYNNDGMRASYRASNHSFNLLARNGVRIEGNTVTQNGEPLFKIHRRHAARKTQGCYRELMPTLEYVRQEQKQEKPSIRDQLRTVVKQQPEKKSPVKSKTHDMEL